MIEFPAGTAILIPSATLDHANVPLGELGDKTWSEIVEDQTPPTQGPKDLSGQKRASFTQYCPGGLIRYVENNFLTVTLITEEKRENPERHKEMSERQASRWDEGVAMYLTMDELVRHHRSSSSAS